MLVVFLQKDGLRIAQTTASHITSSTACTLGLLKLYGKHFSAMYSTHNILNAHLQTYVRGD